MSVLMHWSEEGFLRRTPPGSEPGDCQHAEIIFLAGTGITDAGGRWTLEVQDSLCVKLGDVTWVSRTRVDGVATIDTPHMRPATITTAWLQTAATLTLFAQSWDCQCDRFPEVEFGYHVAIGRILPQVPAER
jgi:hypothetical protein